MTYKLSIGKENSKYLISRIDAEKTSSKRLYEMGLHSGAEILVKKNDNFGPLILAVHGSRIAVDRKLSEKITVIEVN